MQVDFYHLTRDPAEKLVPTLATKCLDTDARVLLVSASGDQRNSLSKALWTHTPASFLANDFEGAGREADQLILIAEGCNPANDARFVIIADGVWREEALNFDRAFYLFTEERITAARSAWRELTAHADVTPRYWKQDGGRWIEGP